MNEFYFLFVILILSSEVIHFLHNFLPSVNLMQNNDIILY